MLKWKYWKFSCNPQELEIRQSTIYVIRWLSCFLWTSVLCGRLSDFRYVGSVGTNHEVEGRNTKCRLLFLRQTIMVKGFVSKKAGSHKLKAFSRARVELEKWHWFLIHDAMVCINFFCAQCVLHTGRPFCYKYTTGPSISKFKLQVFRIPICPKLFLTYFKFLKPIL